MSAVDSSQPSPMASPAGRGSGRGGQRGRGKVAFLNFGRRQQQAPTEPLQDQQQQQQPPQAHPDLQSQQSSEPDRLRGRSRRGRPRRGGKGKGKEGETSSETGRASSASERGNATAEDVEATIKGTVQPQLGNGPSQIQQQQHPIDDEESTPFNFSLNPAPQTSGPSSSKGPTSVQPQSLREEELKALIESERDKASPRRRKQVGVNPNAVRDMKRIESRKLSIDIKPSSSYNNWGDSPSTDRSDEPPTGPRPSGGRRKGKEKEKKPESRSSQEGSRQPKQRQENLPQGSYFLGDAPQGNPPNQRRAPPPPRRFGGNLTETEPGQVNSTTSPRAATPDQDRPKNSRVVPQRSFGGRLTSPSIDDSADTRNLRPDAAAFEPGKPVETLLPHLRAIANRGKSSPPKYDRWGPDPNTQPGSSSQRLTLSTPRPTPQATVKNNAGSGRGKGKQQQNLKLDGKKFPIIKDMRPHTNTVKGAEDIGTRVHKEIASGAYECMVCYGGVTRKSKIWNCKCCWAVFHLNCVQKWAKQGLEQPPSRPVGADGEPSRRSWRCPACNNPDEEVPQTYTCWCEKTILPEASKYLPPHSCGQTCGKTRTSPRKCPHACDLQCHAGPCPPCTAIGPVQPCYCGRENSQKRCVDTNYEVGWSCENVCDDFMPCGEHTCSKVCHPGLCGACGVKSDLKCYCGNEIKSIKCCDTNTPIMSLESSGTGVSEWLGYWPCDKKCDRLLDCGIHSCQKDCHPQDVLPAHCPMSPDVVNHCPCGKTPLDEILSTPRESCADPIPTCGKVCDKLLKCGHLCNRTCHDDDCGVCLRSIEITCRCGRATSSSLCHQGEESEPPQCMRTCKTGLNCGRHECGDKCCAGESKAMERLASKKKKAFNPGTSNAQNDDGFEPEHICTRPCGRVLKCGTHNCPMLCHRGPCGTCLEASFEDLSCHCGRTTIAAPVPCGAKPPVCSFPCAREKDCNHPLVPHPCHPDEENCPKCPYLTEKTCLCGKKSVKLVPCWRELVSCGTECGKKLSCGSHICHKICHKGGQCDEPCKQQCGKPKPSCGHPCLDSCHAPFQCSEEKLCTAKIQLTCACGGLKSEIKCGTSKGNPIGNKKELKCTDACRSRRMALALELDPERDVTPSYSDETIYLYMKDKKFATTVEAKFRLFADNKNSKRLAFQPMRSPQRAFLHILAADFGFESESQDPEPYRSVIVFKGPNFTAAPRKSIADYLATKPTGSQAAIPVSIQQLRKPRKDSYNALVLKGIRVGLLASDLDKELEPVLTDSQLRFSLQWVGDEEVLLEPKTSSLASEQIELELTELSPKLKRLVAQKGLAESAELCSVGRDGQILGRQGNQWSMVTSNKGAPPTKLSQAAFSMKNGFSVFGSGDGGAGPSNQRSSESLRKKLVLEKKKEKEKEEVVEDWETAADDAADDEATTFESRGSS